MNLTRNSTVLPDQASEQRSQSETKSAGELEYRPISVTAIVALVLAIVSSSSLINLSMLIVAIAAVGMGIVAIRRIRNDERIAGLNLARIAIAMALFFAATSMSAYVSYSWRMWSKAQEFSGQWLELLRAGDLNAAHAAANDFRMRPPPGMDFGEYYQPESRYDADLVTDTDQTPSTDKKIFFEQLQPVGNWIIQDGNKCELEFVRRFDYQTDRIGEYFTLLWRYIPDPNASSIAGTYRVSGESLPKQETLFVATMLRKYEQDSTQSHWQMTTLRMIDPKPKRKVRMMQTGGDEGVSDKSAGDRKK